MTGLFALCLGALRYVHYLREESRRAQCHNAILGIEIYGLHPASCTPCRREMINSLGDNAISVEARVAWIRELGRNGGKDAAVRRALRKASEDKDPTISNAACEALRLLGGD